MPEMGRGGIKLSFDRADPYSSVFRLAEGGEDYKKPFDLVDIYATTEYVTSERLQDKFSTLDIQPFSYTYDDCDVIGTVKIIRFHPV